MIILAALVLFRASRRLAVTLRKHLDRAPDTPMKRLWTARAQTPADDGGVDHAGQQVSPWTALDDLQLNRLLRGSAPH